MKKEQKTRQKLLDIAFDEVYIHGYTATSVDRILKIAKIPKGSMYHYFKSKKALVLAMIEERLFVKMDQFFIFEPKEGATVLKTLRDTFAHMSKNRPLITYGCPLYRLMVELSAVDKDFDEVLSKKAKQMQESLKDLLQLGIDNGEFRTTLDTDALSWFILQSTWGVLSLSPSLSSQQKFINHSKYIFKLLKEYQN
jgi:TetR/AcrR family transcriptional repressor of nem operon